MRTLHVGLRVADVDTSIAFYASIGYEVLGRVPATELGSLTMLKLPGDEFVTLELVDDPTPDSTGLEHLEPPRDQGRVDGGDGGPAARRGDRGRRTDVT